jgi:hypothetical protein
MSANTEAALLKLAEKYYFGPLLIAGEPFSSFVRLSLTSKSRFYDFCVR